MTIDKATESGWRPVTKQDLIDIIDSGKPLSARFRDAENGEWKCDLLVGFQIIQGRMWYTKSTRTNWQHCEVKPVVLRDPKFSDLENGPIECLVYLHGENHTPERGILVGMRYHPNERNKTGLAYHVSRQGQPEDGTSYNVSWCVKVVDGGVALLSPTTQPAQAELTTDDDDWRTPTAEDLKNGPIECEVRDFHDSVWEKRKLQRISLDANFPYRTASCGWKFCRIPK